MDPSEFDRSWREAAVPQLRTYADALGRDITNGTSSFLEASTALHHRSVIIGITFLPNMDQWMEWLDVTLAKAVEP